MAGQEADRPKPPEPPFTPRQDGPTRVSLANLLCRPTVFRLCERLGVHVTPVHFYQPVPDTRQVNDALWARADPPAGVRVDEDAMEAALAELAARFGDEFNALPRIERDGDGGFHLHNRRFESVDAEICYALLRQRKPKRVVEVGSGFSTLLMLEALRRNAEEGSPATMTTIDPFPFERLAGAHTQGFELHKIPVQQEPLATFERLEQGDVLFIDSSHVSAIGSDVNYEVLEVLPRLHPGVLVHFHDIFLPADYPKEWVMRHHRFWTEQYLLQAFLAFNDAYRVVWGGNWMHLRRSEALRRHIDSYDPQTVTPGSIWIERVG